MPRDLFGDIERPTVRVGTRSRYTVPLSLAAHAVAILAIVGATVLGPVVLPGLASSDIVYTTITLPPAPPPPAPPAPRDSAAPPPNPNAAPTAAPEGIAPEPVRPADAWPSDEPVTGIVPGASTIDTVMGEPPPPPPVPQVPVPVGGNIRPPTKVRDVPPVYPAIAQAARVQGIVILEATIGVDGVVQSARVLRSIPLLDDAALAAVRQWRYTPTLLNGTPVPVVMTVTVNFQLR
ncbi:MAG: energy transducer TonB [Acidobacteria bacterium]|nr:energy transducer TonB [Acidobacteriota bacterium]